MGSDCTVDVPVLALPDARLLERQRAEPLAVRVADQPAFIAGGLVDFPGRLMEFRKTCVDDSSSLR